MTEDVKSGDDVIKPPASNQSKVSKETWLRIQVDYESGNYKSMAELASRYGVGDGALEKRVERGKWSERQRALCRKVTETVGKVAETEVQSYLKRTFKRTEKWASIIDASVQFSGSKTPEGVPLLDPGAIDEYTKSEARIHELAKSALRIVDSKNVDVTSGGMSIAENVTEAIKKLRNQPLPELTSEEMDRLKDCRIEGEEGPV